MIARDGIVGWDVLGWMGGRDGCMDWMDEYVG
jgi:uncharacterized protein YbdZ (MbtH family)